MEIFGVSKTYIYGLIKNNTLTIPHKQCPFETEFCISQPIPLLFDEKYKIFYKNKIFNSYVLSEEENVYLLYSVDNKTTMVDKKVILESNTIYTFNITNENEFTRRVELYENNEMFPGIVLKGQVFNDTVMTKYGNGKCIFLDNHPNQKIISVLLYKISGKTYNFIEKVESKDKKHKRIKKAHFLDGSEFKVVAECKNFYLVEKERIRGILLKDMIKNYLNDFVKIKVKDQEWGYVFTRYEIGTSKSKNTELYEGMVGKGVIAKICNFGAIVSVNGFKGRLVVSEISSNYIKNWKSHLENIISEKNELTGIIYNVDFEKNRFDFSLKKYELQEKENELNSGIKLQVPFNDKQNIKETEIEVKINEKNKDLSLKSEENKKVDFCTETKRDILKTEEDYLMEIKNMPKSALPIIKYISFKIERNEDVREFYKEFIKKMEGKEKMDLCVSYINYLIFINEENIINEIKRCYTICDKSKNIDFIDIVIQNIKEIKNDLLKFECFKYYFKIKETNKSFKILVEFLLKNGKIEEGFEIIKKNINYNSIGIDLLYKYKTKDLRVRIENLVCGVDGWVSYLKNEWNDIEYVRRLFQRVVDMDWKIKEIVIFYKLWIEFEEENGGDVEVVKSIAREHAERLKIKS
ncbi:hypothetical protein LUQ84_002722 [Hamiltosporidium tvaerminnensis]|nr:hypothetical protein LUQ84_002722 [Hamiltosporidium tvaerminnensis]